MTMTANHALQRTRHDARVCNRCVPLRIDSNGAWFISFELLPRTPGDNAYAIVSTNGVRVFDLP
jgi:hypothetical protein